MCAFAINDAGVDTLSSAPSKFLDPPLILFYAILSFYLFLNKGRVTESSPNIRYTQALQRIALTEVEPRILKQGTKPKGLGMKSPQRGPEEKPRYAE